MQPDEINSVEIIIAFVSDSTARVILHKVFHIAENVK